MLLNELENTRDAETEYKIFCDLDGVLADMVSGIKKLVPNYSEERNLNDSKYRSEIWNEVKKFSEAGGKLWGELDVMPDAYQLWDYIKKYNPNILTAAGNPKYGATEQKLEWFPRNFGSGTNIIIVRKSTDKAQYTAPNHILIDDMDKSIKPWIAAGGIGILHTSATKTISELKKLGL